MATLVSGGYTAAPFSPLTWVSAIAGWMTRIADLNARAHRVEALNALSDTALEQLGLTRSEIPRHVFADLLNDK